MDNFLGHDESQPWGFCQHNPNTQPCPHCLSMFKRHSSFYKKHTLQMAEVSHTCSLSRLPIPPEVLEQLDRLLAQAIQLMGEKKETPILSPSLWDAILILRHTGRRLSELERLNAPSQTDHIGCLEQDTNGIWWLHIPDSKRTLNQSYRIPISAESGVVEAIQRQEQRIAGISDPFGKQSLFRGLTMTIAIPSALRKLAAHLTYRGQPYIIRAHQFHHTIVLNPPSHLLHHTSSLPITMYYLHDYHPSLDIEQN